MWLDVSDRVDTTFQVTCASHTPEVLADRPRFQTGVDDVLLIKVGGLGFASWACSRPAPSKTRSGTAEEGRHQITHVLDEKEIQHNTDREGGPFSGRLKSRWVPRTEEERASWWPAPIVLLKQLKVISLCRSWPSWRRAPLQHCSRPSLRHPRS
jgi:hypothetical protein